MKVKNIERFRADLFKAITTAYPGARDYAITCAAGVDLDALQDNYPFSLLEHCEKFIFTVNDKIVALPRPLKVNDLYLIVTDQVVAIIDQSGNEFLPVAVYSINDCSKLEIIALVSRDLAQREK